MRIKPKSTPLPWECYPITSRSPFYGLRQVGQDKGMAEIVDTYMDTAVLTKEDAELIVLAVSTLGIIVDMADALDNQSVQSDFVNFSIPIETVEAYRRALGRSWL